MHMTPSSITGVDTPDRSGLSALIETGCSARIRLGLSICSRCGLCADSCFYYRSSGNDPKFSPAYKVKQTLGELMRRGPNVDAPFLEACRDILWRRCTLCRRCSLFCPFGIDMAAMMGLARSICHWLGVAPEKLLEFTRNCKMTGNHMGLSSQELIDTCEWMVEETREEYPGVSIPIDRPGVRYMYTINPREVVFYPQDLAHAAVLLSAAGESWTLPSRGWDCTNLPMFAGDREVAAQMVREVYDKALELGVERILITECGHAYRSLAFEGPYFLGIEGGKPPVAVVHMVQLLDEYLQQGRLRVDPQKKIQLPVTYQDPCNLSRNGGLWNAARRLIGSIAEDFRDMEPNREFNHCCGGGAGLMPMGPEHKPSRMAAGRLKAEQIRATGAKIVIAPCHNCQDQIKDLSEAYGLEVQVRSFKEVLCEMIVHPGGPATTGQTDTGG